MADRIDGGRREPDAADADLVRRWSTIVRGVGAAQQAVAAGVEAVGVPSSYLPALLLLLDAEENRLPMSRLARDLSMTTGGFTKLADRMGRDGLIDRRGSAGDRRVVFAALTDHGLTVARTAQAEYRRLLREEVLPVIGAADVRAMADSAQRLVQALGGALVDPESFQLAQPEPGSPERRRRRSE